MRILLVNHEFTITGASTVLLRLAAHLQARGHSLTVLPANPADGPIKTAYEALGIGIASGAALSAFDIAIANGIGTTQAVIDIAGRVPTIWFLHEAEVGLRILLKNPALGQAFGIAAAVVYQTAYQAEVYSSFTYALPPQKFHIIPNGLPPLPESLPAVRPKARPVRLVQVGSVEPRKRGGDLIRAVAASGLDMECVLCGRVYELDEAARRLADAEPARFILTGEVPPETALAWIESADISALVSSSETQGLSAYEAAQFAKPLLLSDLPVHRGVFTHGQSALMAPVGHVELLAANLALLAGNPGLRAQLGQAAAQAVRGFTVERFFLQFEAVIAGLAA